jgi:hypothetical protein
LVSKSVAVLVASILLAVPTRAPAQDNKAELDALKAELAKARADLDQTKKELARTRADLEVLQAQVWRVLGPPKKIPTPAVQAELVKRWNAVAADQKFPVPGGFGAVNFTWAEYGNFPHPTFRGGSGEAYGAFAKVMVQFLRAGDNFEFMTKNGLFDTELETGVPGGSLRGTGWSFASFVRQFSDPKTFAKIDDDTAKGLRELAKKLPEPMKK